MDNKRYIDKLEESGALSRVEWAKLLSSWSETDRAYAAEKARGIAQARFGSQVYVRGLIEFTNHCKNDCYYCGIRKSNRKVQRYRLTREEILECCEMGYELGFRTFVLQGGEDPFFTRGRMVDIVKAIKERYSDCALTLSIGEQGRGDYEAYYAAGADRFLLRHETAGEEHYQKLHPKNLSLTNRKECLKTLKQIGYQTGCGFMVGSPGQTVESLVEDMLFIRELNPHMVGIGPFIPHQDTPFRSEPQGSLELTLFLLSLLRIMLKNVLLPSTTALGTISPSGREQGILAGGNVVMPNLSPLDVRKKYMLYDNKICTSDEAAECRHCLQGRMNSIGYEVVTARGDYPQIAREEMKIQERERVRGAECPTEKESQR